MKRTFINWIGLLGVISLISYTAAVVFSPLAYPGYHWTEQAVSDLSAANAPSRALWDQLCVLYGPCGLVSVMTVCVFVQDKLNRTLRAGIYLFAAMNWISGVGYALFPLSESGYAGKFQDVMHAVVTVLVVALSIASLAAVMIGGLREKRFKRLGMWAAAALLMMAAGAVGVMTVPSAYFGIPERFGVFSAAGFQAVLGVYLFNGFGLGRAK